MKISSFVVLALLSHGFCFSAEGFSLKDIPKASDEKPHTGFVDLGEPSPTPFMYESTSKGNGVLILKNLKIRVYDGQPLPVVRSEPEHELGELVGVICSTAVRAWLRRS